MAVGKSNSNSDHSPVSKQDSDVNESVVNVEEFQNLDDRQLDALLSQHKIEIAKDADLVDKVRAIIRHQVSLGRELIGEGTLQVLPDGHREELATFLHR